MKKEEKEDNITPWLGIVGFIFIGALVLYINITSFLKSMKSQQNWKQTQGTILKSSVVTQSAKQIDKYIPSVEYSYNIANKKYIGSRIHFYNQKLINLDKATSIIKEYPKNQSVTVYYNSLEPTDSALVVDSIEYSDALLETLFGVFFLLLGLLFLYLKIKDSISTQKR
jgi:multisubunit Na+/H+ antiporter MnhB subunit